MVAADFVTQHVANTCGLICIPKGNLCVCAYFNAMRKERQLSTESLGLE